MTEPTRETIRESREELIRKREEIGRKMDAAMKFTAGCIVLYVILAIAGFIVATMK